MHARQTSKKIRVALHVRRMNGGHWGSHTPLGYKRDPDRMGHLLVDSETKWIVEKIFDLAAHGMGAAKIVRRLYEEQIPTPGWLHYSRDGTYTQFYQDEPERKRYTWNMTAVRKILKDENYIGNSIHNQMSVVSFKNKKLTRNPESEWIRVENTHEPIISRDVFDQVQEQIANRRRAQKDGTTQIFAGLVKCADCGWTMRFGRQNSGKRSGYYACGKYYQTVDRQCTMHFIRYDTPYAYVLDRLQFWVALAMTDEQELLERILRRGGQNQAAERKRRAAELRKAEKRKSAVNELFVKMYEDWSAGRITESNFNLLSERYQGEQVELDSKISALKAAMESAEQSVEDAEKWVNLIRQYSEIMELDAPLLNTLIEKIVVHEGTKGADGVREQEVEIYYRFVGKIDA